jgi:hypothetical protein
MKKNENQESNQKQKPRRLRLNRETVQVLDPGLLELARGEGGANTGGTSAMATEGCL